MEKVEVVFKKDAYPYRKGQKAFVKAESVETVLKWYVDVVETAEKVPETAGNSQNSSVRAPDDTKVVEPSKNAPENAENKSMEGRKAKKSK